VQDVEVFLRTKKQWAGVYISTSALPLSTPTGEVNGMVIAISDITNRKISEIELRNSELTKRALLDAVPDVMFRVNRAGVFLDYIPAKKEKFVPAAAFIGNRLEDALPKDIARSIMNTIDVVINNGEIRTFTFEHLVEELYHFYEVRVTPVNDEEVLCIVRDVTDMVAAQDAIKKSEVYFQRLIQKHPAPVVIHDRDGVVVEVNPACLTLLGLTEESDLLGKNIFSFVKAKQRTKARNVVKRGYTDNFPDTAAIFTIVDIQEQEKQVEAVGSIITYQHKRVVQVVMREIH